MWLAQAFAAVQASVVHLQGVPLSKRFALVPLGPPLLSYSSTCKACCSGLLQTLALMCTEVILARKSALAQELAAISLNLVVY